MTAESNITFHLSFHHPRRRAEEVTAALRIDPDRCWDKGAACNTASGAPRGGRQKETYWNVELPVGDDISLDKAIGEQLGRLEPQKAFVREWADSGGRIVLETYWRVSRVFHTELPCRLLERLAEFGIGLELNPTD